MNKAITDGIVFMPLQFRAGLGVWSSGDGTPGSDTYAASSTAAFISADQDFGGCLEIQKTSSTTKLRYMAQTPILAGCYLRISAKVKAISGAFPKVSIAGYAGKNGGASVSGVQTTASETELNTYGKVVEISAIVGTANRTGVDLSWGAVDFGHFGINLTGPNGSVVRIDDIKIEDVSSVFQGDLISRINVQDYGATGNGTTDDTAAFAAADSVANGRTIIVPKGTYNIAGDITIQSNIRFEGKITQPNDKRFILQRNYNYESYLDAFKDEELAFQKAYQALINFSDHESLDLNGRRINFTKPMNMQAADPRRTKYATRRVIRNGQLRAITSTKWETTQVTSNGTYATNNRLQLTNVSNIANIPVGALIEAAGVGREVYVRSVNVGQRTLTLSRPLYNAVGTRSYTFKRFKYILDFSGYDSLSQFVLDDIEFQCEGNASAIMLAPAGLTFHLRDSFITKPKDRGLTSIGRGCQGLMIDRCQLVSNEQALPVSSRKTIGFNANANDVKIRDNRVALFKHFCILSGTGNLINGNHWFHGDDQTNSERKGGIILTAPNCMTAITGNYIDNNFIELSNEHDETPAFGVQLSFGGLTVTGNVFTTLGAASWFNFIVIRPYGAGHFIHGLSVTGNVFRCINGNIDRIDSVNTTDADLDYTRMRAVNFSNNTFTGVNQPVYNPAPLSHTQSTAQTTWRVNTAQKLPFGGHARYVDNVMPTEKLSDSSNQGVFDLPYAAGSKGGDKRSVEFTFSRATRGTLRYTVRMDNPL